MGKAKRPRKPKPTEALAPMSPEPVRLPERQSSPVGRPVLYDLVQTIRAAVGAMLDVADAAAEAITRRIEGRA